MGRNEFSNEQEEAFGHLVADNFGARIQTGWTIDQIPYVSVQHTPNARIRTYFVEADGTVHYEPA